MTITNEDVVKSLGNLTVLEMIALTKELEQKWGVEAKPQAVQFQQQAKEEVVVKEEWNIFLVSVPADKKMSVIKAVRDALGLGLKESKEMVESAPKLLKESASKADADNLVAKLTEAGALLEVK